MPRQKESAALVAKHRRPTRDDIDYLYRLFLGRALEDEKIFEDHWSKLEWRECVKSILESNEYKSNCIRHLDMDVLVYGKTSYGFVMPISFREPLTLRAYLSDCYEGDESKYIFGALSPGDVAIDLGARHGWFTGIMAAAVGPQGRVYSFEPKPPTAGVRELADINRFRNIVVIDAGVADSAHVVPFDSATLSMSKSGTDMINLTTLDTVFEGLADDVKVIKADVEGAEMLAFKGGEKLITRCHPILVFELYSEKLSEVSRCSPRQMIDWLRSCGYSRFNALDGTDVAGLAFGSGILNIVARV